MVRVSDVARLTLEGLPQDVDHHSPLDKQCTYVWQAMRQYAERNNWETYTHGAKPGHKGAFTMRYFIENLFPRATTDERKVTQQIVSRVLRQTGAAVCIYTPSSAEMRSGTKPTWYVSDTMPENLIVIATHHKQGGPTPGPPDRLSQVANKLTPHEAGEDRVPAPVEVRQMTQDTPEPSKAERDLVVNDQFVQEIFEQIATCPVPVTIPELVILTDKPTWACRHAAERLVTKGKLIWRSESKDEKRVRGGGQLPPARPSRLYWPAPGPVPVRTALPPGIKPVKTSRDHALDRMQQRAADDERIYEALKPGAKHRTSGRIAEDLGIPVPRVKASLLRMLDQGRLRRHDASHQYHWADSKRRASPRPTPTEPVRWERQPPPEALTPPPPETLTDQIHRLVDELAKTDAVTENRVLRAKVAVLQQRVTELESENQEMSGKLERFRAMLD